LVVLFSHCEETWTASDLSCHSNNLLLPFLDLNVQLNNLSKVESLL
jgi:hypothetical protein